MCFPTTFVLYQINHARSNHFTGLCLPVMLQAKCLGSFCPEPKALTFSHQQPALKWLWVCSSCVTGGKGGLKTPCNWACSCLFDDLFNLRDTNPLSLKENVAVLNSSCYVAKSNIWKQRPWMHSWTSPLIVQSLFHGSSVLGQSHAFKGTWESQDW